jgi:site-specific recombinase XerD
VKNLDVAYHQIVVRDGKGHKDSVTMLPQHVKAALQQHLLDVQPFHTPDLEAGGGGGSLPYALERKDPNTPDEWVWQEVFPAARLSRAPRTGSVLRHHRHKLVLGYDLRTIQACLGHRDVSTR